jgi:glycerol kinase
MPEYIAAIDQGTTSTRFIIFDHGGYIISVDQKEHRQVYPKPGWVEHDPLEIWENTQEVMQAALQKSGLKPADLAAIGITNQRETTVIWDRVSGKPIHNAIVWQDTRTDAICSDLAKEGGQDRLRNKTGLPLATYFSAPKIKWLLDNVPGALGRSENGDLLFGNMDSWIIWNLTGVHVTDVTNASRTLLMNLKTLDWDAEILGLLGIPRSLLPEIRSSSEIYASARGQFAGVPVSGDLGDQQAALFGQTCFTPGEAKNTYGTGCFMLMNTGLEAVASKSGLLTTLGYKIGSDPAVYALEGSIAITGALVQWLRDNLKMIIRSADIETLAAAPSLA